jgi:fatty-acyl-CoA synthase
MTQPASELRHLSHVVGANAPQLREQTIGAALRESAQSWPEREALVSVAEGVRLSFAELSARATNIAAGLLSLGLKSGDRIGIWSPNNVGWTLTQFAAAEAGLILVTINPAYRISELEHALTTVQVAAVVCTESFKTSNYITMLEQLAPEIAGSQIGELHSTRLPDLRLAVKLGGAARNGWIDLSAVEAHASDTLRAEVDRIGATISATDAVNVQFTSGTTGLPKGAMLSHRNILNNGFMVGRALGLTTGDRLCIPVPLYHCFGMVMGNLACLTHGATMVYPAAGFAPAAVLATVERERCTHLYGVPTMFIAMLAHDNFARTDFRSLRGGCMAGAPCPIEVMQQVIERMNMSEVTIAYGMTETSPVSFQTSRDDPVEQRIATVGRVQAHLECKVVGPDGATLPVGEAGELCTKGYAVMMGYWGDDMRTAEAIDADGFMHTGDLATIDAEGYCRIVGRIKDMIIRGGENIYPREIEEFLYRHPEIEDVAVVGVPDEHFGEEVCAWIRCKAGSSLTTAMVAECCRDQISHYKIPRYIRIVNEFPTTVTGKIQKFRIREIMTAELAALGARRIS